jgi:hypothetical protein
VFESLIIFVPHIQGLFNFSEYRLATVWKLLQHSTSDAVSYSSRAFI